jgi:hypothetical protein
MTFNQSENFLHSMSKFCETKSTCGTQLVSTPIVAGGESSLINLEGLNLFEKGLYSSINYRSFLSLSEKEIPSKIINKVILGYEAIMEVYHCFGFQRPSNKSESKVSHKQYNQIMINSIVRAILYLKAQGFSEWMAYFKYKTLAFYAFYETEREELMPVPKGLEGDRPGCIFGGVAHQWVLLLRKKDFKLFLSFIVSINLAKTGLPRPTTDMLRAAELKTATHLTTEPGPLPEPATLCERAVHGTPTILDKATMCTQLERIVEELFEGVTYTEEDHYEPFYPSTSSNYNRSRSQLGCVGEIYFKFGKDYEGEFNWSGYDQMASGISTVDIEKVDCTLQVKTSTEYGSKGIEEKKELEGNLQQINAECLEFDSSNLRRKWIEFMDTLEQEAYLEAPICEPLGLAEACKVRVISKGPPLLYTFLKPFQKFLWRTLKNQKVFRLIGTPCTTEMINEVMGLIDDSEIIVNGDYKASTDNLHSWVSEILAKKLITVLNKNGMTSQHKTYFLGERFEEMLIRSLTGHFFAMPNSGVLLPQKEGQLMGSITSFPFLCMANAVFCRWSLELANGKRYRIRDRPLACRSTIAPLLINGDDCTLKGDRKTLREMWEKITSFGGLTSSVGKTLFSRIDRPVCVINSQTYDFDKASLTWVRRLNINLGLLLGYTRSTSTADDDTQLNKRPFELLGCVQRELKKVCPSAIWKEVSHRFIHYNSKELSRYPNLQWDVPEWLGGCGLELDRPMSWQTRVAASFLVAMSSNKLYKIKKPVPDAEWHLHKLVNSKLEGYGLIEQPYLEVQRGHREQEGVSSLDFNNLFGESFYEDPFEDCEDNFSRLYKYLTVSTLFEYDLDEVYTSKQRLGDTATRTHLHNNRIWSIAMNYCRNWNFNIPGLIVRDQEDFTYEKKPTYIPALEKRKLEEISPINTVTLELGLLNNAEGLLPFGARRTITVNQNHEPSFNHLRSLTAQELRKKRL